MHRTPSLRNSPLRRHAQIPWPRRSAVNRSDADAAPSRAPTKSPTGNGDARTRRCRPRCAAHAPRHTRGQRGRAHCQGIPGPAASAAFAAGAGRRRPLPVPVPVPVPPPLPAKQTAASEGGGGPRASGQARPLVTASCARGLRPGPPPPRTRTPLVHAGEPARPPRTCAGRENPRSAAESRSANPPWPWWIPATPRARGFPQRPLPTAPPRGKAPTLNHARALARRWPR